MIQVEKSTKWYNILVRAIVDVVITIGVGGFLVLVFPIFVAVSYSFIFNAENSHILEILLFPYLFSLFIIYPYIIGLIKKRGSIKIRHRLTVDEIKSAVKRLFSPIVKTKNIITRIMNTPQETWVKLGKSFGYVVLVIIGIVVGIILLILLGSFVVSLSATTIIIILLVLILLK